MSDVTIEIVEATPIVLTFDACDPVTTVEAYLATLDEYDSDASAASGGVAVGGWYVTAYNHIEGTGGILKKRLI